MKNLTLIIPAKNEPESLPIVISELSKYDYNINIILHKSDIETIQSLNGLNVNIIYQNNIQ